MSKLINYLICVVLIVVCVVAVFEKQVSCIFFGFEYKTPVEYSGFLIHVPRSMRYKKYKDSAIFFYLFDDRYVEVGQRSDRQFSVDDITGELASKGIFHKYVIEKIHGYDIAKFEIEENDKDLPKYIFYFLGTNIFMAFYGEQDNLLDLDKLMLNITISSQLNQ